MLAMDDGRVRPDDLASKFVPQWAGVPRKSEITLASPCQPHLRHGGCKGRPFAARSSYGLERGLLEATSATKRSRTLLLRPIRQAR
jgi:hypothetical protein